jgi:hypothetical protein
MDELIQKILNALCESMGSLREIQKRTEFNDKMIISEVLEKLMEAQGFVMDFQVAYQPLLSDKERAEQEIKEHKQSAENESQYEPFLFFSGSTVMVLKEGDGHGYTKQWYCKQCFDNRKESQLQVKPNTFWDYFCPNCKTLYYLNPQDQEAYNEVNQVPKSPSVDIITRSRFIPPQF